MSLNKTLKIIKHFYLFFFFFFLSFNIPLFPHNHVAKTSILNNRCPEIYFGKEKKERRHVISRSIGLALGEMRLIAIWPLLAISPSAQGIFNWERIKAGLGSASCVVACFLRPQVVYGLFNRVRHLAGIVNLNLRVTLILVIGMCVCRN